MHKHSFHAALLCTGLLASTAFAAPDAKGLIAARAGFVTQAVKSNFTARGPAEAAPAGWALLRYRSGASSLAAYVTPDPKDGKRHPAILWAHGGFGGVGPSSLKQVEPLAAVGLVVLCPSWRGENDNRGRYEMFYGEVDDALAALEHLAKLPYVDPDRLYVAGHSTGGTMALLIAESTDRPRAVFSFGGAPDMERMVATGGYTVATPPFPPGRAREAELRSPMRFVSAIKTPTFYFEGLRNFAYVEDAKKMAEAARREHVPLTAQAIVGGDHFTIVEPLLALIASKIAAGNVAITPEEAQSAFADTRPPARVRHAPTAFDMTLENRGADVCFAVPEGKEGEEACQGLDPAAARAEIARSVMAPAELVTLAFAQFDGWTAMVQATFLAQPVGLDTPRNRDDFVGGMKSTMFKSLPGGRLRGNEPGSEYSTVTLNGRHAIKAIIETPAAAGSPEANFNRSVFYVLPSESGVMRVDFTAGEAHMADLDRFADASMAGARIKAPRTPSPAFRTGFMVGRVMAVLAPFFLIGLGAVVGILVFGRRAKAKRA